MLIVVSSAGRGLVATLVSSNIEEDGTGLSCEVDLLNAETKNPPVWQRLGSDLTHFAAKEKLTKPFLVTAIG